MSKFDLDSELGLTPDSKGRRVSTPPTEPAKFKKGKCYEKLRGNPGYVCIVKVGFMGKELGLQGGPTWYYTVRNQKGEHFDQFEGYFLRSYQTQPMKGEPLDFDLDSELGL